MTHTHGFVVILYFFIPFSTFIVASNAEEPERTPRVQTQSSDLRFKANLLFSNAKIVDTPLKQISISERDQAYIYNRLDLQKSKYDVKIATSKTISLITGCSAGAALATVMLPGLLTAAIFKAIGDVQATLVLSEANRAAVKAIAYELTRERLPHCGSPERFRT